MPDPRPPSHLRRSKLARRVQVVLALAAAGFALYRLLSVLMGKSPLSP